MSFSFGCWNNALELTNGKQGCGCCLSDLWDRTVQLKNGRRPRRQFVRLWNQDWEQREAATPRHRDDAQKEKIIP